MEKKTLATLQLNFEKTAKKTVEIDLPASKSLANRALIIHAITGFKSSISNLSNANDTRILEQVLSNKTDVADIEDAGTAMRFSLAYFALTGQEKIIKGTDRMHNRPIGPLVDALRALGAQILYLEKDGYPPVKTGARILIGENSANENNSLEIPADTSSQFISALILCAPLLERDTVLSLKGTIFSKPYIDMTLALSSFFGGQSKWINENEILLSIEPYSPKEYRVEPDWSAASYWFSIAALAKDSSILLKNLSLSSLQGDAAITPIICGALPLKATETEKGLVLEATQETKKSEEVFIDFRPIPDMAQSILPLFSCFQVPVRMVGLESLRIKETDRILALQKELAKFNVKFEEEKEGEFLLDPSDFKIPATSNEGGVFIETYLDHRMAMGFAPLAIVSPNLNIENPDVVRKSYPHFWEDLKEAGFEMS